MPSLMNEWTSDSLLDDMKKLTEAVMSLFVAACGPCTVCMYSPLSYYELFDECSVCAF